MFIHEKRFNAVSKLIGALHFISKANTDVGKYNKALKILLLLNSKIVV